MVNKRKGDAKELRDRAKKKKSDNTNKGMQSFAHSVRLHLVLIHHHVGCLLFRLPIPIRKLFKVR